MSAIATALRVVRASGWSRGNCGAAARDPRIDALKFYAIVLVVASHALGRNDWTAIDERIVAVIVTFNMPLFMFLSGYVLAGREGSSPSGFLLKKFLALMVPRYAWLVVYGLIGGLGLTEMPARLLRATYSSSGLWFLYVLFLFFVVFSLTRMLPRSDLVLVAVALVAASLRPLGLPLASTAVLGMKYAFLLPYFVAGYLVAKHRESLCRWRIPALAGAPLVFLFSVVLSPEIHDPAWYFALRELLHGLGLAGSYPLLLLYRATVGIWGIAASWALYAALPLWLIRPQAWAGMRSLGIYLSEGLFVRANIGAGLLGLTVTSAAIVSCALALIAAVGRIPVLGALFFGKVQGKRRASRAGSAAR